MKKKVNIDEHIFINNVEITRHIKNGHIDFYDAHKYSSFLFFKKILIFRKETKKERKKKRKERKKDVLHTYRRKERKKERRK